MHLKGTKNMEFNVIEVVNCKRGYTKPDLQYRKDIEKQ